MSQSHVKFYPGWDRAELVACADPSSEARERIRSLFPKCRSYDTYERHLESEELDLVVVATRANLHHPITTAAAEAGAKAILCEKPMALDLGTAEQMVRGCRDRGVRLAIGNQRRYDPQYQFAKQAVISGKIGKPVAAEAYWPCSAGYYLGGHTRSIDGGGFVMYLGVHVFDMLHYCLGKVRSVSARLGKKSAESDVEDSAVCQLTMENGVPATVHLGEFLYDITGSPPGAASLRFFITGTEGSITFGDFSLSVWVSRVRSSVWEEFPASADDGSKSGFQRLHEALFESIESGTPTLCDGETALEAQRVAMACYQSAFHGSPVDMAEVPSHSPIAALDEERAKEIWAIGGL